MKTLLHNAGGQVKGLASFQPDTIARAVPAANPVFAQAKMPDEDFRITRTPAGVSMTAIKRPGITME